MGVREVKTGVFEVISVAGTQGVLTSRGFVSIHVKPTMRSDRPGVMAVAAPLRMGHAHNFAQYIRTSIYTDANGASWTIHSTTTLWQTTPTTPNQEQNR